MTDIAIASAAFIAGALSTVGVITLGILIAGVVRNIRMRRKPSIGPGPQGVPSNIRVVPDPRGDQ